MTAAQWQAVQRGMGGILPEWEGTDLKQRSTQQQIVVRQLWSMAEDGAEFLQRWKVKAAGGVEWLRQREQSREWLRLVVRAWREEVERHGGRDGRALPQHKRRVHWDWQAAPRTKSRRPEPHVASSSNHAFTASDQASFPSFPTPEAADHVHRRIRAATSYMRVMHKQHEEKKATRKRKADERQAAEAEAKRVAGERRTREVEERRAAEREQRADRTAGPAARTRDGSTRPAPEVAKRIEKQRGSRAQRRGPTHVRARVGHVAVGMLEWVYRPRRGDG